MELEIRHALPLDKNLLTYLTSMTVSWTRKKLSITKSDNGLAYWNGFHISLPDLRNSNYSFAVDYSLEKQFSFYSALTFHESMHAKFYSHRANINLLSNNQYIPSNMIPFAKFLNNVFEDGRVERLGLIKRSGSVIHHQLYSFNILISESNWKNYEKLYFKSPLDEFLNHIINQLFDLILLGRKFVSDFLNNSEKEIIDEINSILNKTVFNSFDPNSSVQATITFFKLLSSYFDKTGESTQEIQLPNIQTIVVHLRLLILT